MFNPIQFYEFGKSRGDLPNLFIAGVASYLNTPSLLADKMFIFNTSTPFPSTSIKNFTIVGNDINCFITQDYTLKSNAFGNNVEIISYLDNFRCKSALASFASSNKIQTIELKECVTIGASFAQLDGGFTDFLTSVILPKCTNATGIRHFRTRRKMDVLYIPLITSLGDTVLNNTVFESRSGSGKIYANPFLQTSNSGAEEGDIAFARTTGANIVYVTNFTIPNKVTNLSAGTIYNTAVQLNFTAPSSANTIDYYECYANGIFKNKISASSESITGLDPSTNYNFKVIAVDIFFNKSEFSNVINQSTNTTLYYQQEKIFSYYKLEDNANDFKNLNNGTAFNVTYVNGQVGRGVSLNGTNGYIDLNSNAIIGGKSKFSISINFKNLGKTANNVLYGSFQAGATKIIIRIHLGNIQFFTFTNAQVGGNLVAFSDTTNFHNLICTYDGTTMLGYLDGSLLPISYSQTGTINTGGENEKIGLERTNFGNAIIDDLAIFSGDLTLAQVEIVNNKLKAGQTLI
jgi:hypothetical protein